MGILVYWGLVVLCTVVLEGAPSVPGNVNEEAPHFLSQPLELVVNEGNVVRLPCMVDTLAGFVLIWRKNGRIISIGDQIVEKSESKFHLEDSKNGNTLVIENVDETDEAHFSCSISTASGAEIDHNVRVITRMSGHEMDHLAVENHPVALLEEIENSEQGSGFVPDANENIIQIVQEPRDDEEEEEEGKVIVDNKDASSVGKVYFARIPSFYTFPDESTKDVTEKEQLIKHMPKSVREFLKLLRIYQSSVLTKDDIQEFQEFIFEKKPIPDTHLLRSTHAYNSNLRKRLQSANVKEMENQKVISEEDSLRNEDLKTESSPREDVFQPEHQVKDYVDTTSELALNHHVGTSRESQSSPEERHEEESFDDLGSGESVDESKTSFTEIDWKIDVDKHEQYHSGVRYLQGHNIGNMEDEDIEYISEDKKFPTLRGQYLPKVDIEDYDWEPENFKEKVTNEDSEDDASFVRKIKSGEVVDKESYETKSKTNEEPEDYKELAENKECEDDPLFVRKIKSEDVLGKESDETKSKTNEDDSIKINEYDHNEKETENEKLDGVHVESKVKIHWYESRPEHYVSADRYLQESEIGQVETEQDTGEEDTYIPLFRGQHLLKTDLQVSETEHREDADEHERERKAEELPETEESENDIHPKHISYEGRLVSELHNEAEEVPESYFPLSCCEPKTNLKSSETEEVLDEAETVIHSKQILNEESLEIEVYNELKGTLDKVSDKHGEETLETLSLETSLDIDKHGENIHEKSDDNNLGSKAHLYEEANYEIDLSSSPRYLKEDEIEQIEDETDLTKEATSPVIRGQHLPQSTLKEFNSKHLEDMAEEDEESFKPETIGNTGQAQSPKESEKTHKHVTPESSTNQIEHSVKDSTNTLHIDIDKETLYPQEIKDIERSYFIQKPQEEKVLLSVEDTKTNDGYGQVTVEDHQERDLNEQNTNIKLAFDQDRKIEEGIVLVSSEDLQKNDLNKDATEIRIAQDKEMGPLQVVLKNGSKEKIAEHTPAMEKKGKNKESRRDGPHPFRFICMLRKCGT